MPACFKDRSKIIISVLLIHLFSFHANCQVETLLPQIDQSSGLPSNAIRCLQLDNHKRVWAGTDNGLTIISANTTAQKRIIQKMGIASIWGLNFLGNMVFIGSRFEGLYIFDEKNGKLL